MTQHSIVLEEVSKQINEARLQHKSKLLTLVEEIEMKDPLLFFKAGEKRFFGQRFFWTDSESMTIAGLGEAYTIETNENQFKFSDVERKWRQFISDSVLKNQENISGTGPLLFGGFSFDAGKEKSALWRNFPNTKFKLPMYMYTVKDNQAWLTVNIVCHPDSQVEEIIQDLNSMKMAFFQCEQPFLEKLEQIGYSENEVESEAWMDSVQAVTKTIQNGELEKVVLARELRLSFDKSVDISKVIFNLRRNQANSYIFAFESNHDCFLGASPERLVKKEKNQLLSTCLAGSIGRGKTVEEDEELGDALLQDKKNIIEHEIVVHMIKEAMQEVCQSISTPKQPTLYKTKHIQHLYTPVVGIVKDHISLLSVIEKLHPTPALGGFPKEKAIQKIREIECLDRGWYAAPIGWLDFSGDGEFAVAIRSGLVQETEVSLFAGCGIVGDSDPVSEYQETKMKFKPMLSALGGVKHENN